MTKSELRKIYLERQRSLSADETAAKSRHIADRFFESFDLSQVKNLHCFLQIAKFNEIDTSLIYEKIWADFPAVRTIAPHANVETGEMENRLFTAETQFVESRWGISEPIGGQIVDADEIDLVLVPLLCFDEGGFRVGYGKGFYDKFLAKCRPDSVKAGLSYFPPVEAINGIGDHDIPLDFCVTPEQTYQTKRGR